MGSMISTAEAREPVQDGPSLGPSGVSPGFLPPAAAAIAKQQGVHPAGSQVQHASSTQVTQATCDCNRPGDPSQITTIYLVP